MTPYTFSLGLRNKNKTLTGNFCFSLGLFFPFLQWKLTVISSFLPLESADIVVLESWVPSTRTAVGDMFENLLVTQQIVLFLFISTLHLDNLHGYVNTGFSHPSPPSTSHQKSIKRKWECIFFFSFILLQMPTVLNTNAFCHSSTKNTMLAECRAKWGVSARLLRIQELESIIYSFFIPVLNTYND